MSNELSPQINKYAYLTECIYRDLLAGKKRKEIFSDYRGHLTSPQIHAIIMRHKLKEKADAVIANVDKELWEHKVPLMQQIAGMSLTTIYERLQQVVNDPETRKNMPIAEVAALMKIATSANEMLRLEAGLSTQNVSIEHIKNNDTKALTIVLESLKNDPVLSDESDTTEPI